MKIRNATYFPLPDKDDLEKARELVKQLVGIDDDHRRTTRKNLQIVPETETDDEDLQELQHRTGRHGD